MVNFVKFQTPFCFCSQIECWFSGLEFTKYCQNQSDLCLQCLSRLVWQAASVQSFIIFTVLRLNYFLVALSRPSCIILGRNKGLLF